MALVAVCGNFSAASGRGSPFHSLAVTHLPMYIPNKIPRSTRITRIWNILLSTVLLAYGTFGIYIDDIYLPSKTSSGTHFHGEPLWLLYGAMISASLNMISVVADHYDVRNNEINYKRFAKITQVIGLVLFALALALDFFVFKKGTRF